MNNNKKEPNPMRDEFIQGIFDKFDPKLMYLDFRRNAYSVCAAIGLHFHKEVRDFFVCCVDTKCCGVINELKIRYYYHTFQLLADQ